MDNVLITGGSGFIGQWLCRTPHGIIVPINSDTYRAGYWQEGQWRYIIHLAPVPIDDVIQCAKRSNATVLFASSGGVYDREPSEYFRMKREDENKLIVSGLDYRIARIFTTCGAGMDWGRYAIGNFIMQAEAGGPIRVFNHGGSGPVVRSYLYGSDLAEWLWAILAKGEAGTIYNVGSDVPSTTHELAFEIMRYYPNVAVRDERKEYPDPRPYYVPDISRVRDELGLEIKVPFEEAVRLTVEDYRNEHPGI